METTVVFLERLRSRLGGVSDYKLALALGVKTTTVTNYLKRGRTMDDKVAIKVADALEISPAYVVACVHAERAEDGESTRLWTEIAAKFAACFVFAVAAMPLFSLVK